MKKGPLRWMGLKLDGGGEAGGWSREDKEFIRGLRRLGSKGGLIYSGPAPDREGEISAVWPTYPSGKPQMLPVMQIVRIRLGAEPRFIGRDHGCCGDTLEAFHRGDLNDQDGIETVRSSTFLKIPDGAIDGRFPLYLGAGCTVRFSPAIDDTPRPDNDAPVPAVGNVARKFTAVFDAVGLMTWFDKAGKAWVLIRTGVMDDAMATYSDHGGPLVDVDWIDTSQISKDDNPAFWTWLTSVQPGGKSTQMR